MKKMKKLTSVLLALVMMLSLSVTAFAAGSGSITITNAVEGETYTAYKLFEVTSADTNGDNTKDAYSYYVKAVNTNGTYSKPTLVSQLEQIGLSFTVSADGSEYLVNTETNGGELKFSKTEGNTTTYVTAAELAQKINSALKETTPTIALTSAGTATATKAEGATTASATISNLDAGYYFVDSSLGSLCALDTAADTVEIYEKNSAPTITKQVMEDPESTNGTYQNWADGDVIDTIDYKLTVNTGTNNSHKDIGTQTGVDGDYVITDSLPTGIIVKDVKDESETVSKYVTITTPGTTENEKTTWMKGTDYNEDWNATNRTLTITLLSTGKLSSLVQNTDITITYKATMSYNGTNGVKVDTAGTATGNTNIVTLKYQQQTSTDQAIVYTYQIGGTTADNKPIIQKVDGTTNAALAGVKFTLQQSSADGKYAKMAELKEDATDTDKVTGYILTGWVDAIPETPASGEIYEVVTDSNGGIIVKGLDEGTYILTETATLSGYNLLDDTITVKIARTVTEDTSLTNNVNITYKMTSDTGVAGTSIAIKNNTGTPLPSTGGMGTTIFYIVGGILVIVAAILLITRRRMNAAK